MTTKHTQGDRGYILVQPNAWTPDEIYQATEPSIRVEIEVVSSNKDYTTYKSVRGQSGYRTIPSKFITITH